VGSVAQPALAIFLPPSSLSTTAMSLARSLLRSAAVAARAGTATAAAAPRAAVAVAPRRTFSSAPVSRSDALMVHRNTDYK
jgi:hypothetical protein